MRKNNRHRALIRYRAITLALAVVTLAALAPAALRSQGAEEIRARMTVSAGKGLNLRQEATETSPVVAVIPDGDVVFIDQVWPRKTTVAGRQGHWVSVTWKEKRGHVFSAFLKKKYPPGFRFNSTFTVVSSFLFAEGHEAACIILAGDDNIRHGRGTLTVVQLLPPLTEVTVVIGGVAALPALKAGQTLRVIYRVQSVIPRPAGELLNYSVHGQFISMAIDAP